jgi:hypothetical protein
VYYYLGHQYENLDGNKCINVNKYNKPTKKYVPTCIPITEFQNALNYAINKKEYFLNYLVTYSSNEGPLDFKKIGEKYNIKISQNPINDKKTIKESIRKNLNKDANGFVNYLLNDGKDGGALRFQVLADDFNITQKKGTYKKRIDELIKAPDNPETGYKWDVDKEEWVQRKNKNDNWTLMYP